MPPPVMTFEAALTGDWSKATRVLALMSSRMRDAQAAALRKEAEFIRQKIVEGIRDQAPAGKRFKPLSPTTLLLRQFVGIKGDKALIERGDLIRSIIVLKGGRDSVSVGVSPDAVNSEGRSLAKIAHIQENGANYQLNLTDRMRKYLAMAFRKMGAERTKGDQGPGNKKTLHIVIPPRPFIGPVFEKYVNTAEFEKRIAKNLLSSLVGL